MSEQLSLFQGPYQFTQVGLEVSGESTPQQWETAGEALKRVDEARQWAIGDWLCDGKRHYGDGLYKKAAALTGLSEGVLRQYKSLSSQFELLARTNNLSYRHHYEVASLRKTVIRKDGTLEVGDEPDRELIEDLLKQAARNGESAVALREKVRDAKDQQREAIRLANAPDKYSVIYADPPWQYTSGDQHTDEEQETTLGNHYPSMSLRELCQLPVLNIAADDAVLLLWTTSPVLEEAFEVITAWGFNYKASVVWDKVLHNVGNYVSVRHELLLICTRGTPPKVRKLIDSVYEEERTEHSRKPEYFRQWIDDTWGTGKRIEMFARGALPDGWDAWGNEAEVDL